MSTLPPINDSTQSSETKEEVGARLEALNDVYIDHDEAQAHQTILAPSTGASSDNEVNPPHKASWYKKIAEKVGAYVTKDAAYYKYGNNVYYPDTGKTEFEFMPLYTRIGMHALFTGSPQEHILEDGYLLNLFRKESVKTGKHFDDPKSVASIPGFVKTYSLPLDELLIPDIQNGYKNFNDFFSRKLKEGARPPADPQNPRVMVSPADCRAVVYQSVSEAQKIWIKGDKFSIPNLLRNTVPDVSKYLNSSIGVFRLAPQDYHRWHSPVDGTIVDQPRDIDGGLFTVNPMAVRSTLDVLTSNKRSTMAVLTPFSQTPVLIIAVGALLVGSISYSCDTSPGTQITKGQELGYFSYGGSTVIVVWPQDAQFQVEEVINEQSQNGVETLVRVGTKVGTVHGNAMV